MKNFNLNLKWRTECAGTVEVVAETLEEAIEKINRDKERYLLLSRNGYMGFNEVSEIQEIVENSKLTEECVIEDVKYVSVWDNGNEIIETKAKYNKDTGEVFDIEGYSGEKIEYLTTLDSEYILLETEKKYVFSVKNSEKKVTGDYILNIFEESILAFGDNMAIIYNESENQIKILYEDDCNSFLYVEEIFEAMCNESIRSLVGLFNAYDYKVEEE